jgi:hypothetical protein
MLDLPRAVFLHIHLDGPADMPELPSGRLLPRLQQLTAEQIQHVWSTLYLMGCRGVGSNALHALSNTVAAGQSKRHALLPRCPLYCRYTFSERRSVEFDLPAVSEFHATDDWDADHVLHFREFAGNDATAVLWRIGEGDKRIVDVAKAAFLESSLFTGVADIVESLLTVSVDTLVAPPCQPYLLDDEVVWGEEDDASVVQRVLPLSSTSCLEKNIVLGEMPRAATRLLAPGPVSSRLAAYYKK